MHRPGSGALTPARHRAPGTRHRVTSSPWGQPPRQSGSPGSPILRILSETPVCLLHVSSGPGEGAGPASASQSASPAGAHGPAEQLGSPLSAARIGPWGGHDPVLSAGGGQQDIYVPTVLKLVLMHAIMYMHANWLV